MGVCDGVNIPSVNHGWTLMIITVVVPYRRASMTTIVLSSFSLVLLLFPIRLNACFGQCRRSLVKGKKC